MSTAPDDIDKLIDDAAGSNGNGQGGFVEFSFGAERVSTIKGRSLRDRERLLQGLGAVYTVRRAAELLPGNDADNRAWLRQHGLVRVVGGTEVVVWAEVLDMISGRREDAPDAPPPARRRKGKKRAVLPRVEIKPLATGTDG